MSSHVGQVEDQLQGLRRPVPLVRPSLFLLVAVVIPSIVSGCAVVAVADAAVTVAATGVKVAAKTTGAVVDAAISDGDDDED